MIEKKGLIVPPEKRVYAYFRVANPDNLIKLQKELPTTQLNLVNPQTFHLTYIHFGKPTELYNEISKYTNISFEGFLKKIHRFLDIMEGPLKIRAMATSVNTLGDPDNPTVAATLDLSEDAYIARECYLDWLDEEILSTRNSWESSAQSKIINWEPAESLHRVYSDYIPHITIAQSDKPLSSPINFNIPPMEIRLNGIFVKR